MLVQLLSGTKPRNHSGIPSDQSHAPTAQPELNAQTKVGCCKCNGSCASWKSTEKVKTRVPLCTKTACKGCRETERSRSTMSELNPKNSFSMNSASAMSGFHLCDISSKVNGSGGYILGKPLLYMLQCVPNSTYPQMHTSGHLVFLHLRANECLKTKDHGSAPVNWKKKEGAKKKTMCCKQKTEKDREGKAEASKMTLWRVG